MTRIFVVKDYAFLGVAVILFCLLTITFFSRSNALKELAEANEKVATLEKKANDLTAERNATVEKLESGFVEQSRKIDALEVEKISQSTKISRLENNVSVKDAEIGEMTKRIADMQTSFSKLSTEKDALLNYKAGREALDRAEAERRESARLAEEAKKRGLDALKDWANDPNPSMRIVLIRFIVGADREKIETVGYPLIIRMLDSNTESVALEARNALSCNLDPVHPGIGVAGIKYILKAVADKSFSLTAKEKAKIAVINIGDKAVPHLLAACNTEDKDVWEWAVYCLCHILNNGAGEETIATAKKSTNTKIALSAKFVWERVSCARVEKEREKEKQVSFSAISATRSPSPTPPGLVVNITTSTPVTNHVNVPDSKVVIQTPPPAATPTYWRCR